MVFHGFKGDPDIDEILREIPPKEKSRYIKEAIRKHALPKQEVVVTPPKPETYRVKLIHGQNT